jgi:hypothetical protein
MTNPAEAGHHPGPPGLLWAPSLANITEIPWRPGFAAWHRQWEVWVRLVAEDPYGTHPPHDAILLTPEQPSNGTPDLATKIEHLEQVITQMREGPR